MTMKRLLGPALLALVLLAGCGDSELRHREQPQRPVVDLCGGEQRDGRAVADRRPEPQTIAIVSQTAAGGSVDLNAVPVDDEASMQAFTQQFERAASTRRSRRPSRARPSRRGHRDRGGGLHRLRRTSRRHRDAGSRRLGVQPQKVDKPLQECFAPVTSVAARRRTRLRSGRRRVLGPPRQDAASQHLAHRFTGPPVAGTVWTPRRPGTTKPTRRPFGLHATPMAYCPEQ